VEDIFERRTVEAGVEPEPRQAGGKAIQVRVEAEEAALPDVDDVVGAVRPGHTEVEHGDLRLLDRAERPVDVGRSVGPAAFGHDPPTVADCPPGA
jgi:hypothetical protein